MPDEPVVQATPEWPLYRKFPQEKKNPEGTQLWGIVCDEGWRESIVCTHMYEWAADWLLEVLGRRPFAPDGDGRDPVMEH